MSSAIVLHLINSAPMQSWTFASEETIQIGRATDNNVVLFSAVVSRHHAELRWNDTTGWEICNMSANGTYIEGEAIKSAPVLDGTVFRLATSGPRIEVKIKEL